MRNEQSDIDLHCVSGQICFNAYGKYITVQSLYSTPHCNTDLDITWPCGSQFFTMEFYKRTQTVGLD